MVGPLPLSSRGRRLAAHLLDTAVIVGVALVCVVLGFVFANLATDKGGDAFISAVMLGVLLGLVGGAAIQLVHQLAYGRSVGKRLLGLRVVRVDGSRVEPWRVIVLRNLVVQVAGQLCGLIPLIDALFIFGADQRCLHDLLADTVVIDDP